jgi:nitroreductase/NAD-dependent dihydropyrimidine dehydrogenase PreA subunit
MHLTVNPDTCTLCGACIPTCPTEMVRSKGDHIKIGRVACIECGHCIAICPTGAIVDEDQPTLSHIASSLPSPDALAALIRKRRTIRRYEPDAVSRETLESVLDAARWAPTAANCQAQQYLILQDKAAIAQLRDRVEAHYRTFAEALADRENRVARLEALGLDGEFATHPHMLAAVPAFVKAVDNGRDRLFFEAPVVIIVHAAKDEVMPESACAFATMTLTLMAEACGLGTCITGYASDALRTRADICDDLGIPTGHQVHYVVVLGWPAEEFPRVPERKPVQAEWR